jgi:hypothetical protein
MLPPLPRLWRTSRKPLRGPLYVSAKRTHRFGSENGRLCVCAANCYADYGDDFSVGSFWKTNPPGGCFEGGNDGFGTEFGAISEADAIGLGAHGMVKAPWLLEGHWYRGRWLPQTTAASRLTRLDKLSMTGYGTARGGQVRDHRVRLQLSMTKNLRGLTLWRGGGIQCRAYIHSTS